MLRHPPVTGSSPGDPLPRWSLLLAALAGCDGTPAARLASPLACNGHEALCGRSVEDVVFPATHNAMSSRDEGWIAPNQEHPPRRQLEDGIRGMLLDTYWWEGEAVLCHGYCELGASRLVDVLGDLAAFLDREPGEVLFLVFQDALDAERTEAAFREAGLFDRLYAHPDPDAPWPTLGELVEADTRVIATRESGGDGPDWYRPFYRLGFDTPYGFRTQEDFSCDVLRGDPSHRLFLMNHWISDPLPTQAGAAVVNAPGFLGERVRACTEAFGRAPNLVAVDFYEQGELLRVVAEANGLAD